MTTGTTEDTADESPRRLNAPLVRALMWGAGYATIEQLAGAIGIHKSQVGRAYGRPAATGTGWSQETSPSLKMLEALSVRFPLVPFVALVRREGDPLLRPEALGLTPAQVAEVYPEEAATEDAG